MTAPQSEAELEKGLVEQLVSLGYDYVEIKDEGGLLANFRKQLALFNGVSAFSDCNYVSLRIPFAIPVIYPKCYQNILY